VVEVLPFEVVPFDELLPDLVTVLDLDEDGLCAVVLLFGEVRVTLLSPVLVVLDPFLVADVFPKSVDRVTICCKPTPSLKALLLCPKLRRSPP
jgi:hypothetical protein